MTKDKSEEEILRLCMFETNKEEFLLLFKCIEKRNEEFILNFEKFTQLLRNLRKSKEPPRPKTPVQIEE